VQAVEKIDDAVSQLVLKVKLFTLGDVLSALKKCSCSKVNVLQKVLCSRFEKQNLVVMVSMVAQVAALLAN